MRAKDVYDGSNGELTKAYYLELATHGAIGLVALNLFRASKASARAKVYRGGGRGGSFRSMAYQKKSWSLAQLAEILKTEGDALGLAWGWKEDPTTVFGEEPSWVLYVDLPDGQVSFHAPSRGEGPVYSKEWDGEHKSAERIIAFCDRLAVGELAL